MRFVTPKFYMKRTLEKNQIELFLNIIDLMQSIMDKYEGSSYEAAIFGLTKGLEKYLEKEDTDIKLDLYLVWWIKTSIEYDLDYKNKDTEIWQNDVVSE